jgi:hypothetical protein
MSYFQAIGLLATTFQAAKNGLYALKNLLRAGSDQFDQWESKTRANLTAGFTEEEMVKLPREKQKENEFFYYAACAGLCGLSTYQLVTGQENPITIMLEIGAIAKTAWDVIPENSKPVLPLHKLYVVVGKENRENHAENRLSAQVRPDSTTLKVSR